MMIKYIAITWGLLVGPLHSAEASHISLKVKDDEVALSGISQISVGKTLVVGGIDGCVVSNYAEIIFSHDNVERLRDFTGKHIGEKISLIHGQKIVFEFQIAEKLEGGRLYLAFSGTKKADAFSKFLDDLEKLHQK